MERTLLTLLVVRAIFFKEFQYAKDNLKKSPMKTPIHLPYCHIKFNYNVIMAYYLVVFKIIKL